MYIIRILYLFKITIQTPITTQFYSTGKVRASRSIRGSSTPHPISLSTQVARHSELVVPMVPPEVPTGHTSLAMTDSCSVGNGMQPTGKGKCFTEAPLRPREITTAHHADLSR